MDIIGMLQDGNGALAWLTAVLLALGGTAVVVAFWAQMRRGIPAITVLKVALGFRRKARGPAPTISPVSESPQKSKPVPQGIDAYKAEAARRPTEPESSQTDVTNISPSAGNRTVLSERQLTVYLTRLRRAADTLEEVARQEAPMSESHAEDSLLATH